MLVVLFWCGLLALFTDVVLGLAWCAGRLLAVGFDSGCLCLIGWIGLLWRCLGYFVILMRY